MTAKRFILKSDYDWWFVKDTTGEIKGEYDEWFSDKEVVDLLNALHEENQKLKSKYSEQCIQLDFLKDENQHMRDLVNENEQLKQLLDYAEDLIHSHLSEHYIRQWRNFKTGHKEYNDFWEEKLKKYKELKGDME